MRRVTYSMGVSLDGYIVGPDGGFEWTTPDEEVFRHSLEEFRGVGVYLWDAGCTRRCCSGKTADQDPSLNDSILEWTAMWKPLPKVVLSTTVSTVQGNARLATGSLAEEIGRWRAELVHGDIAIGGATLAGEAAASGLIDEYPGAGLPRAGGRWHALLLARRASR